MYVCATLTIEAKFAKEGLSFGATTLIVWIVASFSCALLLDCSIVVELRQVCVFVSVFPTVTPPQETSPLLLRGARPVACH